MDREVLKASIERNLLDFVASKTSTNSREERNVEEFFKNWFSRLEYFNSNPTYCGFFDIPDDYLDRKVPWCLLKGEGNDTLVFIHHHDTVDTNDYGVLEDLSLSPYELERAFKEGKMDLSETAKEDLLSSKWIFGRGVCDMKGGASIQLSLIEEYSKDPNFKGNIVLISVPDEENLSAGMRGATILLKTLKDKYNLDYKLMLNSEPHERKDYSKATIYDGSIGKILSAVYVRGKLAHAGQIYSGLNPINLLSEIIRRTELNPSFIEKDGNTTSSPPTWLYNKDRKNVYDVSLPQASCGYINILTLKRTPQSFMKDLKEICIDSFRRVLMDMNESYKAYCEIAGVEYSEYEFKPKVKFYSEIFGEAMKDSGLEFEKAYKNLMLNIKDDFISNKITIIEASNKIIELTLRYVKDTSPCVILALIPPYYPSTNNEMLGEKAGKVNALIEDLITYVKDNFDEDLIVQDYFIEISDLSYSMFVSDQRDIDYIENNMLMWKDVYFIPLEIIKDISMPVINIGPWGKDLHKYTERVYKEDLFYKTPLLIDFFVRGLLGSTFNK